MTRFACLACACFMAMQAFWEARGEAEKVPDSTVTRFLNTAMIKEIIVKITAHRNNAAHRIRVAAAQQFGFKHVSFGTTTFMSGVLLPRPACAMCV